MACQRIMGHLSFLVQLGKWPVASGKPQSGKVAITPVQPRWFQPGGPGRLAEHGVQIAHSAERLPTAQQ